MKKGIVGGLMIVVVGLFFSLSPRARANEIIYWDFDNGFNPSVVVIGPSQTVTWRNIDDFFTTQVTFNNNFSFSIAPGQGQGVIFPAQTGVYSFQSDWTGNGAVIVNIAPTNTITAPANNAVFSAPATFTIQATASETPDDYVSDVEFFLGNSDGTNSLEDVFTEPFSTTVTDLPAGTYTLIAVARDSHGWTTEKSVAVTVGGSSTVNLSASRIAVGQFVFDISGLKVGKTNVVLTSTNFVSWTPIKTNIAASVSLTVTNPMSLGLRFYRIYQLP